MANNDWWDPGNWWESVTSWFAPTGAPQPTTGQTSANQGTGQITLADLAKMFGLDGSNPAAAGGSGGASGGAASTPAGYYTPDGVFVENGSSQDTYYKMADAVWVKQYGQHAPYSMVQTFHNLGVENTLQLDTVMNQMPSQIQNPDGSFIPLGQYNDLKSTAQQLSDKFLGRPIPDSLIQRWVNDQVATPEGIQLWFLNHPAKDIPKDVYGQIFDQAVGWKQSVWNDLPHPDEVHTIYQQMQQQGIK